MSKKTTLQARVDRALKRAERLLRAIAITCPCPKTTNLRANKIDPQRPAKISWGAQ